MRKIIMSITCFIFISIVSLNYSLAKNKLSPDDFTLKSLVLGKMVNIQEIEKNFGKPYKIWHPHSDDVSRI